MPPAITVRPPHSAEWRACRTLLPESFQARNPPEAFVAWNEEQRALAGVAVFHRRNRETVRTAILTLRPFRRRGIGSLLLRRVCERAEERGDCRAAFRVDLQANPDAAPFLEANGFSRRHLMIEVEGDLDRLRGVVNGVRSRLAGRIPAGVRLVHSPGPSPEVRRLARLLLPRTQPEFAEFHIPQRAESIHLLVGDRPVGMTVGQPNDGRGTGSIFALGVAPAYRGGWGWASVLLLAEAAEFGWNAGAQRIRFSTGADNWQMLQFAERVGAVPVRRVARFVRDLGGAKSQRPAVAYSTGSTDTG